MYQDGWNYQEVSKYSINRIEAVPATYFLRPMARMLSEPLRGIYETLFIPFGNSS